MKRSNKILCMLLASAMVVTSCPMPAHAAEAGTEVTVDDFTYVEGEDGITIKKYTGTATELALADNFPGQVIIGIGEKAFNNNDTITKITLPDTVKTIGNSAFYDCDALTQIEFAGENPALESIGEKAFYGSGKLLKISLPESVKTIGKSAFRDCTSLAQVEFAGETPSLESIEAEVFYDNDSLTKIVLPETVKKIGGSAFRSCGSLAQVEFAGENPSLESIEDSAFQNNGRLLKLTLPENVKTIGSSAFRECGSLNQVEFAGESPALESIGDSAFYLCRGLTNLTLPESVKTIGKSAFGECESLAQVEFAGENPALQSIGASGFYSCDVLADFAFPGNLQSIGDSAFYRTALKDIVLPESLISIGSSAFSYCSSLRTVEVNSQNVAIMANAFSSGNTALVFIGEAGSTAQSYAAERGFTFNRYTDSISINSLPAKTEYFQGEELNTEGLSITVDYTSDTEPATEVVAAGKCTFSGYDKTKAGTQTVTVLYAGKTATFNVTVYYNLEKATVGKINSKDYTGEPIKPDLTITGKETQVKLVEGKDYAVELENNTNAGIATVKIVGIGQYKGEVSKTFTINKRYITAEGITATFPSVSYNGTAQTPVPVIKDGDLPLTEGEDYTIDSYSDNVNAGTGKVYITAKGNYRNSYTSDSFTFTIEPRDINEAAVEDIPEQSYTGNKIEPEIVVSEDEYRVLKKGTDYTVQYTNNTAIGTAKVLITGKGNYKGTIEKTFTIKAKNLKDVTIGAISEQTYNGTEIKPSLTVYDEKHNVSLEEGTDYTVTYENNVNAGTATVILEGIGNYEGTAQTTFTIRPITLSLYNNVAINKIDKCVYSGKGLTPSLELEFNESVILKDGVDYIVTYENNVNVGTATAKIEGKGNYRGVIECEFVIEPQKLSQVTVNDLPGYFYTGKAIKPVIDLKIDGVSLVLNEDFKVRYEDNVNVGTATVHIEGIGNYTGTVERTFDIEKKSLSDIRIRNMADYIYTGQEICPAPSLELDVNTALTLGVDYVVSYENNINVGTATVRVRGIGNYSGVTEKTFKIVPKSLSTASLSVASVVGYTGEKVTPYVNLVMGSKTLILDKEYTVTYSNNKNIGTAKVTVTGIGNYTGTLSASFKIQAKKGSKYTVGAYIYKITSTKEVAFAGLKKSSQKKVSIPKEVKIGGQKFKVTSIASKALKGKSVTSVTIGKNVKEIGISAFEKCSKLKKITVKGTVLKKVGKKAFKGINAKAVIKVPKKKLKAYKNLMKNKGQSSAVKIK